MFDSNEQFRRESSATSEITDQARKTVDSLKIIGFNIDKPIRAVLMSSHDHSLLVLPNGDAVAVSSNEQVNISVPSKPRLINFQCNIQKSSTVED